ncbi:MAG: SDR family NAD(P)-dependent oxidoreductase [Gemmatimonadetes bacterium]|nr:SDR family NAD(P)-dependent oxidoreductase [Gemmatimonadota bacterium]
MNRLAGKRVLITGASSGFGAAMARRFAEQGSHLLLSARRVERVEDLATELRKAHRVEVRVDRLDVTDRDAVAAYVADLAASKLIPDVLVNNAGKARGLDKLHEGSLEHWEDMIDTNVKGLLYMTRAVVPHMVARNSGHVVNIGSIAGHWTYPKGAVYNATKASVKAITEGLNMDLLGTNIRVSSVDPGMAETEFSDVRFDGDTGRAKDVYKGVKPLSADDVADVVLYVTNLPAHVNILDVVMMPTAQRAATLVHREGA